MDLSGVFSDDQLAVIGCLIALAVCGLVTALSFRLGPAGKRPDIARSTLSVTPGTAKAQEPIRERRAA